MEGEKGVVVMKGCGVDYERMKGREMVVVELERGKVVEGDVNG